MAWKIDVDKAAAREIKELDPPVARRIFRFLHERVALLDDPRSIGEALRGPKFGELWKYRVGDYRIICRIQDAKLLVLVLRVGHRREIYRG